MGVYFPEMVKKKPKKYQSYYILWTLIFVKKYYFFSELQKYAVIWCSFMSVPTWKKHYRWRCRLLFLMENLIWFPSLGNAAGNNYIFLSHTPECSLLCGRVGDANAEAWPLWQNIKTQGKTAANSWLETVLWTLTVSSFLLHLFK